jgi:hypothetical protein
MVSISKGLLGKGRGKRRGKRRILIMICCLLACAVPSWSSGQSADQYYFRPGLWSSKEAPLKSSELESLVSGLRFCTGFRELRFEQSGKLTLGDRTKLDRGSSTARALLVAAVESRDSFVLESSKYSPTIVFAEIEPTDTYIDARNGKHYVWRVRLDFSDFDSLRGPAKAITSFSPAFVLLHELVHGVLKKPDLLTETDQLGDCERHVNLIRRELKLPERETFQPRSWRAASPGTTAESLQAEFRFSMIDKHSRKTKTFYLAFDVDRVCDIAKVRALPPGRAEIFAAMR